MSILSITRSYEDKNPDNTINEAKLSAVAAEINNYFNNGNITGEQIRVDAISLNEIDETQFVDETFFVKTDGAWGISNLSDSNLSNLDGDELFGNGEVSWNSLVVAQGSVSALSVATTATEQAIDEQVDYTPDSFAVAFINGTSTLSLRVDDSSLGTSNDTLVHQITTRGGPVCIAIVPGSTSARAFITQNSSNDNGVAFEVRREDGAVENPASGTRVNFSPVQFVSNIAGSYERSSLPLVFYDFPTAGTYTYGIRSRNRLSTNDPDEFNLEGMKVVVYELV